MVVNMDNDERKENLDMMRDPNKWVRWPLLPVIKIDDRGEAAIMVANGKPIIYLANIFDLGEFGVRTIKDIVEKIPSKEYSSFDDILDDGWEID